MSLHLLAMDGSERERTENGTVLIEDWMDTQPAPEAVLKLLAWECTRDCRDKCPCGAPGLACTDLCKLKICSNLANYYLQSPEAEQIIKPDDTDDDKDEDEDNYDVWNDMVNTEMRDK